MDNKLKIAFMTLGCKVNQYETDKLKQEATKCGFEVVDLDDADIKADIYCINTCSVTNMSQRKSRQYISMAKSKNPNAIIVATGCAIESAKSDLSSIKADLIIGNKDKENTISFIQKYLENKEKIIKIEDIGNVLTYDEKCILHTAYDIREAVKIEDGCNNFCSYCIIPYTRGRVRSRNIEEIVLEVEGLIKDGVKEIVLVGIEVASYGKDLKNISLVDVIERVNKIKGLERLRLSSIEPTFLTEENIARMAKCEKLCDHFHLSMQSGSNSVLKAMNRKYTKDVLIAACMNLKKYFPNVFLATDVIVGFPGETDDEFLETCDTIRKMGLNRLHVFKYSKRNYTRAARMEGQIDGVIKIKRSDELLKLSENLHKEYLSSFVGKKLPVLFENISNGYVQGYTTNYIKVKVNSGGNNLCGMIQDVDLISLEEESLIGKEVY